MKNEISAIKNVLEGFSNETCAMSNVNQALGEEVEVFCNYFEVAGDVARVTIGVVQRAIIDVDGLLISQVRP